MADHTQPPNLAKRAHCTSLALKPKGPEPHRVFCPSPKYIVSEAFQSSPELVGSKFEGFVGTQLIPNAETQTLNPLSARAFANS